MSKRRAKDDEFIDAAESSDDELRPDDLESEASAVSSNEAGPSAPRVRRAPKSSAPAPAKAKGRDTRSKEKGKGKGKGKAWEGDFEHTWDTVREDERGSLEGAVSEMLLSGRTRR